MNEKPRSPWKMVLYGLVLLVVAFAFGNKKAPPQSGDGEESGQEGEFRHLVFRGWLIVCGISLAFVAYGIFAFLMIGDKNPPGWDFGGVQDIPGASEYSTFPYRLSDAETNPQHVDQRPPEARPHVTGPPPGPGMILEGTESEGPGQGAYRLEYGPED